MKTKSVRPIQLIALCLFFWACAMAQGRVFSQAEVSDVEIVLRDPFESQLPKIELKSEGPDVVEQVKAEIRPPEITVESLVAGGPLPQVIIKGQVYRVGDEVEGAVIKGISKEGITLSYQELDFSSPAPSRLLQYTQGGNNDE